MSWTVAACSPPHFSSTGRVTLRAPDGRELWSRVLDMSRAAAAPDGSFLAVLGADVEVTGAKEVAGPRRLMTLRPTGELILEQREPEDTTLVGVTGNGTIILRSYRAASLRWVTADGGRRGALDLTVDLPVSALLTGTSRLLVWDRHRLQLFTIPD